jgi:tetratricopeptide (TPR) repeat protein
VVHRPPLDKDQPILPELEQLANYHVLDLEELSPDGVAALVTQRLSGQSSPLYLDLIQLQARGNPFFVEELTDTLRELGHLIQQEDGTWALSEQVIAALREASCLRRDRAGQWGLNPDVPLSQADLGLPDSIHGLVLARLDRLLEAHKLTLKVASVIGTVFQFQVLARSHPAGFDAATLQRQVEEVERREFIRLETPSPLLTYIFKHNITRDVAYESLLERQRRALHQAVAEAIEQVLPDAVEQLAYHYGRARVREKTLFYLDIAAQKAQREYANETALSYYHQALALEDHWQWRKGQVEVLHILGRREEERAALEKLATLPDAASFEVDYLWGQYYQAIADYAQAQAAVEQGLQVARSQAETLAEMRCLSQLGLIAGSQGDYELAKSRYRQALALLQDHTDYSDGEAQVLTHALNGLGSTLREQGEFSQVQTIYQQALALSRQIGNRSGEAEALNSLGVVAFYQRDFTVALSSFRQALEIRQAIGDRTGEGKSVYSLAMTVSEMGDYGQAMDYLSMALNIAQETRNRRDEIHVLNVLGILYQELGDLTSARTYLEQGLAIAEEINDVSGQAYLLANLGLVASEARELSEAEQVLTRGLALAQAQDDTRLVANYLNYLSEVSLEARQLDQARDYARESLALRQSLDMQLDTADNLAILAAIGLSASDIPQALSYADQTLAILAEAGEEGPEFPQRDYLICHRVLIAGGEMERAQAVLRSAYDLVMTRAEKITDPALRQSFLGRVVVNREIVRLSEQQ